MDDQPTDAAKWWPGKLLPATYVLVAASTGRVTLPDLFAGDEKLVVSCDATR